MNFFTKIKQIHFLHKDRDKQFCKSKHKHLYVQQQIMRDAIICAKKQVYTNTIHNLQNTSIGDMPNLYK